MKIGIVRHFKVDYKPKKKMNSNEFKNYIISYDNAPVIKNQINLNDKEWSKCYCSDLKRAIITAESFYNKEFEITHLLREVNMYPIKQLKIKIPTFIWSISSRVAWKMNHSSQLETINCTQERARKFLNEINLDSSEDILIISHGFFLITLINELKLLGFKGAIPKRMKNGYIYILEK